jgi:hypothetical protein
MNTEGLGLDAARRKNTIKNPELLRSAIPK